MSLRDNYHLDIYNLEENLLALALKWHKTQRLYN